VCRICGRPKEDHHDFDPEPIKPRPIGCVCDAADWFVDPIPPVCDEYEDDGCGMCLNCEHNRECHAQKGGE